MMKIVAGLEYYNEKILDGLLMRPDITGIVLGDLFCNRKMFDGGSCELLDMINKVGKSEKTLYLQTPVYLTDNLFLELKDLLGFVDKNYPGSVISTQDYGVVSYVGRECKSLSVMWNQFGRSRENYHNRFFFDFLKEMGVQFIESDDENTIQQAISSGLNVNAIHGKYSYVTFGRKCYLCYELHRSPENCKRLCRSTSFELIKADSDLRLSIDGYLLGTKHVYKDNPLALIKRYSINTMMLYAENIEALLDKLDNIQSLLQFS